MLKQVQHDSMGFSSSRKPRAARCLRLATIDSRVTVKPGPNILPHTVIFEISDFGDLEKFKKCTRFLRWIPAQSARMTINKKTRE